MLVLLALVLTAHSPVRAAESESAKVGAQPINDPRLNAALIANSTANPSPLRILVIGAHPADVFDQSGGTMAHHIKRGDWVGCAVVTSGVRVHDKVISDEMHHRKEIPAADELKKSMAERAKVKEKEVLHACSILGVREQDVHFLGADDAVLLVNESMIRQLATLIRKLRPDVILTHYPYEEAAMGSAHAITGQMVMHAIPLAGGVDPGDQTPPHKVTQVFFFGQGSTKPRTDLWGAQGGFYNNIFVDITDVAEKKVACLDAMQSQGYGGAYARKRIETSDGSFGAQVKVPYAEGFITLYSTTNYYLPVSEIDRQHAKDSDHERISRHSYKVNVP
ncbi:MAG: PIG-L deacetylase family protein [Pirellulales bacterium]